MTFHSYSIKLKPHKQKHGAKQSSWYNAGMLIRLESKKGKMIPTLFDERQLGIATREQFEVR